jgi:hypothetical protein
MPVAKSLFAISGSGGIVYAVGQGKLTKGAVYLFDTNSASWKEVRTAASLLRGVCVGGGLVLAVGESGAGLLGNASLGSSWQTIAPPPGGEQLNACAWDGVAFHAVGEQGGIFQLKP